MSRKARFTAIVIVTLIAVGVGIYWKTRIKTDVVRIGAVLPLSGGSARYGTWIQEGLDLATTQINQNGGINGRSLVIVYEDDQAQPTIAASAMQKLVTIDKVPCVFGSWASSSVLAQAPIAEKSKTVLMAEAISPQIREAGDYVFRIQPDARFYLRALVPFVHDKLHAQTASILYVNNDFGVDQAAVFKAEFEKLGGKVLSEESYLPNATDFRAQLTKIASTKPDLLFSPAYAELGTILKQAHELGLNCKFAGSVPTENPDLVKIAGAAAEGIVYPSHFDPDSTDPDTQAFQKAYITKYGRPAEGLAALAYDGLNIIAEGLKRCGSDSNCLKNYLYSVRDYRGVTGVTSFDEKGDVVKPIIIKIVENGKFVPYSNSQRL